MRKVIISGPPHSGKTTLFDALAFSYPEFHYIPEPATTVLERHAAGRAALWTEVFTSPQEFCELCAQESLRAEEEVPPEASTVILDRSLVDTVAYARRDMCEELVPYVQRLAQAARYSMVLFCNPVGQYGCRVESAQAAARTGQYLLGAYEESAIKMYMMPSCSTADRLRLAASILRV
jgi:predicted ATPase